MVLESLTPWEHDILAAQERIAALEVRVKEVEESRLECLQIAEENLVDAIRLGKAMWIAFSPEEQARARLVWHDRFGKEAPNER